LIEAMQLPAQGRALEIGCGTGAVSLAALVRTPGLHLDAIDSAARAVDCAWQSARLNELQERFAVWLSSCRQLPDTGSYDVVLTNPPYFHQLQIAELFLQTARRALRPGGALWAVGKQAGWYRTHVPRLFDRVQVSERGGGYCIVTGRAP
jgi:16S rRNA (guanine1207-N2)-methyltransferase